MSRMVLKLPSDGHLFANLSLHEAVVRQRGLAERGLGLGDFVLVVGKMVKPAAVDNPAAGYFSLMAEHSMCALTSCLSFPNKISPGLALFHRAKSTGLLFRRRATRAPERSRQACSRTSLP